VLSEGSTPRFTMGNECGGMLGYLYRANLCMLGYSIKTNEFYGDFYQFSL